MAQNLGVIFYIFNVFFANILGKSLNCISVTPSTTTIINTTSITSTTSSPDVKRKAPIYTNCLKPGQFVLTFDDGPNPETTPKVLETLKKNNITATFFINAVNYSNLETDPEAIDIVEKTFKEGHDIGSHTYYHKNLFEAIEEGTMEFNIDKMTDTIQSILGVKPAFFRPPHGDGGFLEVEDPHEREMTNEIQTYLAKKNYSIIMWGTDTRDWQYLENIEKVIASLNEELLAPGVSPKTHSFIALLHDVYPTTVDIILPTVIEYVRELGYTFVSLSECIGVSPYQPIPLDDHTCDLNRLTSFQQNQSNSTVDFSSTTVEEFNITSSASHSSPILIMIIFIIFISTILLISK